MKKRIFGFDIGVASLGWAVIDFDDYADPEKGVYPTGAIVKSGVRCFPIAENPKDGKSLALPRRQKRLARRLCRRKARRMSGIKGLFVAKGLIDKESLSSDNPDNIYLAKNKADVWDLRVKALQEKLTTVEFIRVLTHLAKHRGFKSYRIGAEKDDKESGKVLQAIKNNEALLSSDKTLAQIIVEKGGKKRNRNDKNGTATYLNSIPRDEIIRETRLIFERQREFGLSVASAELQEDFERIAFRYQTMRTVKDMIGNCLFVKGEKRAPKQAPSSEFFVAWTKINNTSVYEAGEKRFLTQEERQALFNLLKEKKEVKYADIRKKIFNGRNDILFADIEYNPKPVRNKKTGELKKPEKPEDVKFYELNGYHQLKKTIDISDKSIELLDNIVTVIATQKNDDQIETELKKLGVLADDVTKLQGITFKTFIKLSLKALYKILPEMEKGKKYNEACNAVGYDFKKTGESFVEKKGVFLQPIPEALQTTVPVVNRAISQFRKVYNAMVRRFGTPDQINIELARDVYHDHEERKEIQERQKEYQDEKKRALATACDKLNVSEISGATLLKFRLYEQQDGKSIYSGEDLDIRRLIEQDYCDVDHIIPYSRSQDNSQNNKVLCLSKENREKSNKTPREYITDPEKWAEFCARVGSMKGISKAKKDRLLMCDFAKKEEKFRERNINDTRYMARYIMNYLDDSIDFSKSSVEIKDRVQSRNGALTDFLRHQWGLTKNREDNDRHHAQDAIVIACATNGYTQYLAHLSKIFENKQAYAQKYGEAWYKAFKQHIKQPWVGFYEDVQKSLSEIFVSRPPRKNATGSIHKDTLYPVKAGKGSLFVRGGMVEKENMFRCDIYKKDDRFYVVPQYLADFVAQNSSSVFCPVEKDADGHFKEPDATYRFMFSLYKDDYLKIENEAGECFEGYMNQYDALTGQFYIKVHDSSAGYSLRTSSFEPSEILVLSVDGKRNICQVSGFNNDTKKLQVVSVDTGEIFEIDAMVKENKKGELQKKYKTLISYEKLDKEKKVNVSTFKKLQKFQVSPLGDIVEVKSEKLIPLLPKSEKQRKADRYKNDFYKLHQGKS